MPKSFKLLAVRRGVIVPAVAERIQAVGRDPNRVIDILVGDRVKDRVNGTFVLVKMARKTSWFRAHQKHRERNLDQ
jgi:hypothetical protein